jgi:hypothetical protein
MVQPIPQRTVSTSLLLPFIGKKQKCINKNTLLLDDNKESGLKVKVEKLSIYSWHITRIQNKIINLMIANKSTENETKFKYLVTTVTNQN